MSYGTIRVHKCNCGGVFDDEAALRRHIDASNDWNVLDKLAASDNLEGYRNRLHGNVSYLRDRTEAELDKEQREVERLQANLPAPRGPKPK